MKRAPLAAALALALLVASPSVARADARADAFFKVGASAYKAGRFADAADAFERALAIAPTPGLMFSLGQAHRMEHAARNDPSRLADAVRWYVRYLEADPKGKRAMEATDHLSRLRPLLPSVAAATTSKGAVVAPSPPVAPAAPRVMLSSPTPDATLLFDGKEVALPFIAEVAPGKHQLRLRAPGHGELVRELDVDATNGAPPLDLELTPLPARVTVDAPAGAEIAIDGFVRGEAPLPALALESGRHTVRVTRNGAAPFEETIVLGRGESRSISVQLGATAQRKVAWGLLGMGGAGLVATGALGAVALIAEREATTLLDRMQTAGNEPETSLERYEHLVARRDRFATATAITGGAGGLLVALGGGLFLFDAPPAARLPAPSLDAPPPGAPVVAPAMELSLAPVVGPGLAAATLDLRF